MRVILLLFEFYYIFSQSGGFALWDVMRSLSLIYGCYILAVFVCIELVMGK
jgi:hypothetical protein